jgi:hypothetical protein
MFKDNQFDLFQESATIVITSSTFDKRALCTNDLTALSISLSNMHYLSTSYPARLTILLQENGCLELLIRKARYLSNCGPDPKAEIAFSSALACLASAAACGTAKLRYRIIQAKFVPIILPILSAASSILDSIHQRLHDQQTCIFQNLNHVNESDTFGPECFVLSPTLDDTTTARPSPRRSSSATTFTTTDSATATHSIITTDSITTTSAVTTTTAAATTTTTNLSQIEPTISSSSSIVSTLHSLTIPNQQIQQQNHHYRQVSSDSSFYDDSLLDSEDFNFRNVKVHDLLMITKIVAYISKYEVTRTFLRQRYPLFYLIENLTVPTVVSEIRKWAGSCMRNAVRTSPSIVEKRCGLISCSNVFDSHAEMNSCGSCHAVFYCR